MSQFSAPTEVEFMRTKAWGILTSLDIHECDPKLIADKNMIERFTHELCDKIIRVKRYGETEIVLFGDDPRVHGYSMVQLIESSLVSAHFAEESNSVYLDVFSCAFYDANAVVEYSVPFFKGKSYEAFSILRGVRDLNDAGRFKERNIILQSRQD